MRDNTAKIKTMSSAERTPTVGNTKSARTTACAIVETNYALLIRPLPETYAVLRMLTENALNVETITLNSVVSSEDATKTMNALVILINALNSVFALMDKKVKLMVNAISLLHVEKTLTALPAINAWIMMMMTMITLIKSKNIRTTLVNAYNRTAKLWDILMNMKEPTLKCASLAKVKALIQVLGQAYATAFNRA